MLVSMYLSDTFAVPTELALLYDFVNTLDERRYVEDGAAHAGGDEIATPRLLEAWLRERGLLQRGQQIAPREHRAALDLREALRDFLLKPPEERPHDTDAARKLTAASQKFPLVLAASDDGAVRLVSVSGGNPLGGVLAQMISLAETGRLARLKTCASDECHWIFFDRSKPANRHWCSSARCGNRQKTRAYRVRRRQAS
jgi:predicted RNA-binding Zn ribbon-like protein